MAVTVTAGRTSMRSAAIEWATALTHQQTPEQVASIAPARWPALVPDGTVDHLPPLTYPIVNEIWTVLDSFARSRAEAPDPLDGLP